MTDEDRAKLWRIWEMGQHDPQYRQMLEDLGPLEDRYDKLLSQLSIEEQDLICDFVSHCEAMSWRMLQFACIHMDFQTENTP